MNQLTFGGTPSARLSLAQKFAVSAKELRDLRTLVIMAMMVALSVTFNFVLTIAPTQFLQIKFSFIPNAIAGMMFGPVPGMICTSLVDFISWLVKPTGAYFPGFTLSAAVTGMMYGLFFYKEKITVLRTAICLAIEGAITTLALNTFWLSVFFNTDPNVFFWTRLTKYLIMLPIQTAILRILLNPIRTHLTQILSTRTRR